MGKCATAVPAVLAHGQDTRATSFAPDAKLPANRSTHLARWPSLATGGLLALRARASTQIADTERKLPQAWRTSRGCGSMRGKGAREAWVSGNHRLKLCDDLRGGHRPENGFNCRLCMGRFRPDKAEEEIQSGLLPG